MSDADYRVRLRAAIGRVCGKRPPLALVSRWAAGDESHVDTGEDTLQDWAATHRPYEWMTGIGIIEGCEKMAREINAT